MFLLLERSSRKRFAPGRWTGVGGRVEPGEMSDLETAALRELCEETGIPAEDVQNLEIRVVLTRLEDGDVTTVLFFSGHTHHESMGECNEGRLQWVELDRVDDLDLVENARNALDLALNAEESAFSGLYLAVEDSACGGAIRAVRVNRPVPEFSPGTRE